MTTELPLLQVGLTTVPLVNSSTFFFSRVGLPHSTLWFKKFGFVCLSVLGSILIEKFYWIDLILAIGGYVTCIDCSYLNFIVVSPDP